MALRVIIDVLIAVGFIFALAGTKGILKMPDTFCRMQASTCVSTGVKVLLIGLLLITINPVGAHAIAKGAYKNGIRPDKEMEIDDYRGDFE